MTNEGPSLLLIETGLTIGLVGTAVVCPRAVFWLPAKWTNLVGEIASRRTLAVCLVGLAAVLSRLLILRWLPIPQPSLLDDFSYVLAGDTFASGRLTNPTHPMWVHFESFHISHLPTYMSMYFPAQGMALAAGKLIAGNLWYGVLATCALMCAAICWMLQGWLPPRWALLGGMLAVVRLGLFSYWGNSYTGGAVAAIGGALVLGALPRIRRAFKARHFFWMALGLALLVISRPYEGLLVCVPAVVAVCWWLAKNPRPSASTLLGRMAPAAVLLLLTLAFLAYYDHRVFGNVFTPPYAVNRAQYAVAPHFLWQSPRPEPVYHHAAMREHYSVWELKWFLGSRTPLGLVKNETFKVTWVALFFLGPTLIVPMIMLPRALRDRRLRFIAITACVFALGLAVETWGLPHYTAPFTGGLYAILLQCLRHLRVWQPEGRSIGPFLARALPALCFLLVIVRVSAEPLHIGLSGEGWPVEAWYGTRPLGLPRAHVLAQLDSYPGRELAVVRYSQPHNTFNEWVYNEPDIDKAKVVWAREMDSASNQELLRYFQDRKVWLVEPDSIPPRISPYPASLPVSSNESELALSNARPPSWQHKP